ncbi:MAG: hypothetical protein HY721_30050 [Planctomycetes bacterium]|nr:hypothetical protein [Planctomycetota bacterium]
MSRQVIVKLGGRHLLVWDLKLRSRSGPHRVLVNAVTGEALGSASLLREVDCTPRPKGTGYAVSPAKGQPVSLELVELGCKSPVLDGPYIRTFQWVGTNPFTYDPIFEYGLRGNLVNDQVTFTAQSLDELAQVTMSPWRSCGTGPRR